MKYRWFLLVLFWVFAGLFFEKVNAQSVNKFHDPVIRKIHDLADRRDVAGLMPFFQDSVLKHRGEALMVMGSCWGGVDEAALADSIIQGMVSHIDRIRMVGAFALGQSGADTVAGKIRMLIEKEEKPLVQGMLFDALGKCGDSEDLAWLLEQEVDFQATEGLAMGLFRFGMRQIISKDGNDRMAAVCADGSSLAAMIYASYFLGRYANIEWLQANAVLIRQLLDKERDPVIRSQLVRAVVKAEDEEAWPLAEYILKSDEDYRVKVNIMSQSKYIPWNKAGKLIYEIAEGEDPNMAIAAAEAITREAVYTDLTRHLKAIDNAKNWRSRALLIAKALRLVEGKKNLTKKIEKKLFTYFEQARHASEKALLLKALAADPSQYPVLIDEIKKANAPVIATSSLETIMLMHSSEDFEKFNEEQLKEGTDMHAVFLAVYKEAIASDDVPMVAMAAGMLRNPDLGYKEMIKDLDFLKTALGRMQNPKEIEARNELVYTLAYFMDKQIPQMSLPGYNHPINWERVQLLDPEQQIAFVTEKGEVIVQLNVDWCPGTADAFIELIEKGYFNGLSFHRVVPNFVVQDGCPRGDGWGGPDFTIRSEFTPAPFVEGSLGMASAGQDTEGSQWYFTHSPTPHLDGKYTNFGYVVAGMEVVHQLEVGDVIKRVEVLEL